jgi:hypothetical protein
MDRHAELLRSPDLIGGAMVRGDLRAAQRRRIPVRTRAACPPSRVDTAIVNQYRCVLAQSERAPGKHWASRPLLHREVASGTSWPEARGSVRRIQFRRVRQADALH